MKENKQETIGLKFDSEKVDWSLVPLRSIEEIAKVLAMGKKNMELGTGFMWTML